MLEKQQEKAGLYLITATLLMAICGLIYELLAGTLSSYLLGDSVTQFSLVIGWFLSAMGLGSWLSQFIKKKQLASLIFIEILVGLIGGTLTLTGFFTFTYTELYQVALLAQTGLIGVLVGLEIPLIICILKDFKDLKITVANVMSADYIGALFASLLFPFILIPHLGLNLAGVVTGLANTVIAFLLVLAFKKALAKDYKKLFAFSIFTFSSLLICAFTSNRAINFMENSLYQDEVIYAENSPYQRIVITKWKNDTRLYLNGHLQFSSLDEYRYHETLVHVPMSTLKQKEKILILGGGDGMAAREVLKYSQVKNIDLVDLDPAVTKLFSKNPLLIDLNKNALNDPKVKIHHSDAFSYLQKNGQSYDLIIMDLPDPSDSALSKLYSKSFYGMAARSLRPQGKIIVQSTNPFRSKEAFWCINSTLRDIEIAGKKLQTYPMHINVPSFGNWGFNMASFDDIDKYKLEVQGRFLNQETLNSIFNFPQDMKLDIHEVTTLNSPKIVEFYRKGYKRFMN